MYFNFSKLQYVVWSLIAFYLFGVANLFHQTHHTISNIPATFKIIFFTLLCVNVFLSIWVTRNQMSSTTISFVVLLLSLSIILIGLDPLLPVWFHTLLRGTVSFFPVLFLHFFIEHFAAHKYKSAKCKLYMYFQVHLALLREVVKYVFDERTRNIIFFLGLIFLILFCCIIYRTEKDHYKDIWKPIESSP